MNKKIKSLFEISFVLFLLFIIESTFPFLFLMFNFSKDWTVAELKQTPIIFFLVYAFLIMKLWKINISCQLIKPSIKNIFFVMLSSLLYFILIFPISYPYEFIKNIFSGCIPIAKFNIPDYNNYYYQFYFIKSIIIAPIAEEIFFRGIILTRLKRNFSPIFSIIFSSLVFAISHFSFSKFIRTFLCGLLFGSVFNKYGSLTLSVLSHSLINLLVFFTIRENQPFSSNISVYLIFYLLASIGFWFIIKNLFPIKKS